MADRTDKTSNGRDAPTLCAKMARRRSERDILKLCKFGLLPTLQSGSGIPRPGVDRASHHITRVHATNPLENNHQPPSTVVVSTA